MHPAQKGHRSKNDEWQIEESDETLKKVKKGLLV